MGGGANETLTSGCGGKPRGSHQSKRRWPFGTKWNQQQGSKLGARKSQNHFRDDCEICRGGEKVWVCVCVSSCTIECNLLRYNYFGWCESEIKKEQAEWWFVRATFRFTLLFETVYNQSLC